MISSDKYSLQFVLFGHQHRTSLNSQVHSYNIRALDSDSYRANFLSNQAQTHPYKLKEICRVMGIIFENDNQQMA